MRAYIFLCLHLGCSSPSRLAPTFRDKFVRDLGGNDWLELLDTRKELDRPSVIPTGDHEPMVPDDFDDVLVEERLVEENEIKPNIHPVEAYKIRFRELKYREVLPTCQNPPREIYLDGFDGPHEVNAERFTKGSMTNIYKAYFYGSDQHTVVDRCVVKFITSKADLRLFESLYRDAAALAILSKSGIAPEPMTIVSSDVPSCLTRLMVSSFVGERTLKHVKKNEKFSSNLSMMASIAVRGLEILEILHSKGIVHGDIHFENFAFFNDSPIAKTMKLIDFGRSVPFLDFSEDGYVHVDNPAVQVDTSLPYYWTLTLLSVYELDSIANQREHTMSRRDDMNRFAEMFVVIMLDQYEERLVEVEEDVNAILAIKTESKNFLDSTFREFFEYSSNMAFDEIPQYDFWIAEFQKLIGAGFDTPYLD